MGAIAQESAHSEAEMVRHAMALFEVVGMTARNLAAKARREYQNDLHDLVRWSSPANTREAKLRNPLVSPTSDNRLTSRMTRRMVVETSFGGCLSITVRSDTYIYSVDRSTRSTI